MGLDLEKHYNTPPQHCVTCVFAVPGGVANPFTSAMSSLSMHAIFCSTLSQPILTVGFDKNLFNLGELAGAPG